MTLDEAIDLIRPGVPGAGGTWAELGAGSGLFTRALASLLGPEGVVLAVDRDAAALAVIRSMLPELPAGWARIVPLAGDFHDVPAVAALAGAPADGVLLANALHFAPRPERVLADVVDWLSPRGRVVVVEYDGRPASRWVPYPLPLARLRTLAPAVGLLEPRVVGERPSAYGGIMYSAVLARSASGAGSA